jgi:Enolase C-terminal domain-like
VHCNEQEGRSHVTEWGNPIDRIEVSTYTVPADLPESDGTLQWDSTTLVLVEANGGGETGLGYTHADTANARLIHDLRSKVVAGRGVMATATCCAAMVRSARNLRLPGIDLPGLRFLQDRAPAGTEIAGGEYGYEPGYFRHGGINGFFQAAALCRAYHVPLPAHTAPALHAHVSCAVLPLRQVEYLHDHVRIEQMFFDGYHPPVHAELCPDLSRPGMGSELKRADARSFAA